MMQGIEPAHANDNALPDAPAPSDPTVLSNNNPDFTIHTRRRRRGFARRMRDAVLRPLLAVFTTQSVIVAVLVGLAAVATAQHASQIISEKFAAINAALKRF